MTFILVHKTSPIYPHGGYGHFVAACLYYVHWITPEELTEPYEDSDFGVNEDMGACVAALDMGACVAASKVKNPVSHLVEDLEDSDYEEIWETACEDREISLPCSRESCQHSTRVCTN